jgi:hypothetical protein
MDAADIARQTRSPVDLETPRDNAGTLHLPPSLALQCFDVLVGCISLNDYDVVVVKDLEQLAMTSAECSFRTLHHLSITDPTSSTLIDLRRRYNKVFPRRTKFNGLSFRNTMVVIHALATQSWNDDHSEWANDRPSDREHTWFAQCLVGIAQKEHQRTRPNKVPWWILQFVLDSLSLDPPTPASVVSSCLMIVAIDLGCDVSNTTGSNERCVYVRYKPLF